MTTSFSSDKIKPIEREYTAKEVQAILRTLSGSSEKVGLALLNYYARTDLVSATGRNKQRGRRCYSYADIVLLCWLFRMKRQGLPVNRFRRGIAYLRKRLPRLYKEPKDMVLLTDGKQLYLKNQVEDPNGIVEVLGGNEAGQFVWACKIGSLITEVDQAITGQTQKAA
jgi:DNA-binding transcriptional MerR regulator